MGVNNAKHRPKSRKFVVVYRRDSFVRFGLQCCGSLPWLCARWVNFILIAIARIASLNTMRPALAFPYNAFFSVRDDVDVLLERLTATLSEHYTPLRARACIELQIVDCPDASRRFEFGEAVICARLDASAVVPAARIFTTSTVLATILHNPTCFDPRSAELALLGGLRTEGSERLVAYWLQLLKRPTPAARAALARSIARAPHVPHEVACIDTRDTPAWPHLVGASIRAGLPLRVRTALDWPEVHWTLDEWGQREGAMVLRHDPRTGAAQTLNDLLHADVDLPARFSAGIPYTGGSRVPPAWEARFRLAQFADTPFSPAQLWFGKIGREILVTPLHCDAENSFLAQVHGSKRVRLFPPQEAQNVYALAAFNTFQPCRVDADAPDLRRFPRFADARFVDVSIEAGDLLLIPTGWFHCVWAEGITLSISRVTADTAFECYGSDHEHVGAVSAAGGA